MSRFVSPGFCRHWFKNSKLQWRKPSKGREFEWKKQYQRTIFWFHARKQLKREGCKRKEVDRAYYLQNREKKIAQVKQRRQAKRELPTRPSRTRRELKHDQERDQIKEKRRSIRDSVQAKRALIREQTRNSGRGRRISEQDVEKTRDW